MPISGFGVAYGDQPPAPQGSPEYGGFGNMPPPTATVGTPYTQAQADQQANRQHNMFGTGNPMLGMGGTRSFLSQRTRTLNPMAPGVNGPGMSGFDMHKPILQANGGVAPGHYYGPNAVAQARMSDQARQNAGAAMGPGNAALAGYTMGK
jgi:hypothetical protein